VLTPKFGLMGNLCTVEEVKCDLCKREIFDFYFNLTSHNKLGKHEDTVYCSSKCAHDGITMKVFCEKYIKERFQYDL